MMDVEEYDISYCSVCGDEVVVLLAEIGEGVVCNKTSCVQEFNPEFYANLLENIRKVQEEMKHSKSKSTGP
jgi:hypothetical protein